MSGRHKGSGAGERRPSLAEGAFEQVEVGTAHHAVPVEAGPAVAQEEAGQQKTGQGYADG